MKKLLNTISLLALFALPGIGHTALVDISSNVYTDPVNSATWQGDDGTLFTFESSTVGHTSIDGAIIRLNDFTSNNSLFTLSFSETITSLSLYIHDIDYSSDGFANFSVGPSSTDGDLYITASNSVISRTVNGFGHIYWDNLDTDTISFDWVRTYNMGIGISHIEYETAGVPEPGILGLLATGLIGFAFRKRRQG